MDNGINILIKEHKMAIQDTMMNILRKDPKAPAPEAGSKEEKELKIKTRAGFVINLFALFLAVNTWYEIGRAHV